MREVVALALAAGLARRLAVAFESGWRRDPHSALALALHAGEHCGDGLQRHLTPDWLSVPGSKPQRFSGGPSRACGLAAIQLGIAPAAPKAGRALGAVVSASCRSARKVGLALARAASDNWSIDTDAQVHPCAARTRPVCAGHLQRYEAWR
jgi:hypothetical protein